MLAVRGTAPAREMMMDRSRAVLQLRDRQPLPAEVLWENDEMLAATIRAGFAELSDRLSRLADIYGDSTPGAHARAAAAATIRAKLLADRLRRSAACPRPERQRPDGTRLIVAG
jgi:hypothetical protein